MALAHGVEQGELVLPFRADHVLCSELGADLRARKAPVGVQAVLLLIEGQVGVPPLEKGHDDPRQVQEEFQL